MFKTLTIAYWMGSELPGMGIPNNTEMEYSKSQCHSIQECALGRGYNVMLMQHNEELILWIDKGRFNQR